MEGIAAAQPEPGQSQGPTAAPTELPCAGVAELRAALLSSAEMNLPASAETDQMCLALQSAVEAGCLTDMTFEEAAAGEIYCTRQPAAPPATPAAPLFAAPVAPFVPKAQGWAVPGPQAAAAHASGLHALPPPLPPAFPTRFMTMRTDAPMEIACVPHGGGDPTVLVCQVAGSMVPIPRAATYWDGTHHVRCDGVSNVCRVVYPALEKRDL